MRAGAENRRKTILAGALGAVALCCALYAYNTLFGGPSTPTSPPSLSALTPPSPPAKGAARQVASAPASAVRGNIPGVPASKLATTAAALDPTLEQGAMLRTEHLVYTGSGRNIFSAVYVPPPPPVRLPTHVPPARPQPVVLPPAPAGPPPPPPINLKFFGTAARPGGAREAFLLSGEDVYLASAGEIVARKYKVVQILGNSVIVQDLQSSSTQTLPLQTR